MQRNHILPSEKMKYTVHDCRPEDVKFKNRSKLYDTSVLSTVLSKTKHSLNSVIYDKYLTQSENADEPLNQSEFNRIYDKFDSKLDLNKRDEKL